jgi:hypothetical protein
MLAAAAASLLHLTHPATISSSSSGGTAAPRLWVSMRTEPQQQQQQQSMAGLGMLVAMQQLPWRIISTHTLLLNMLLVMLLVTLELLRQSTWHRWVLGHCLLGKGVGCTAYTVHACCSSSSVFTTYPHTFTSSFTTP